MPLRQLVPLAALVALLLVMPISYRGGTEVAHPHAVFQGWFDAAHGETGHYHPEERVARYAAEHPRASHPVARWATGQDGIATEVPTAEVDAPTLSALNAPLSPVMPLLALASVLLLSVASASWRPLWATAALLPGAILVPDAPPPRRSPLLGLP